MAEITLSDPLGRTIRDTVSFFNLKNNLEIGAWDGTGATQCFIEGMKDFDNKSLKSIEIKEDRFLELKEKVKDYSWVECINNSSINANKLPPFEYIWDSAYMKCPIEHMSYAEKQIEKAGLKRWYDRDKELMSKFDGYLETDSDFYDSVLIDGGEWCGYEEFLQLKDRTDCFFLDDCHTAYKTCKVFYTLKHDDDWHCLLNCVPPHPKSRNGSAVFIKNERFLNEKKQK
tara:strand:+ start:427 stop:1113 length:687 start_codon:yes stop_codon:yes gene_type:complete